MRVLAIRGRNLASLEGEFSIDFTEEPLASAGIFAISGPTGAGKSTLLDAMCLALFSRTPRTELAKENNVRLRDVQEDVLPQSDPRFLLRRGTASGYAEVDFVALNGCRYRARWSVSRAREKESGRLQAARLTLYNIDAGKEEPGTNKDLQARIIELIGLTFDQFTRSVLLAQNDFSTFLKAEQGEKASLLEKLTGTEQYSEISRRIFAKNAEAKEAYEQLYARVQDIELLSEEEVEASQTRLSALADRISEATLRLKRLLDRKERQEACGKQLAALQQKELELHKQLAADENARTELRNQLQSLSEQIDREELDKREQQEKLSQSLSAANALFGNDAWQTGWNKDPESFRETLTDFARQWQANGERLRELERERSAHQAERESYEAFLPPLRKQYEDAAKAYDEKNQSYTRLRSERNLLLGGQPADQVERTFHERVEALKSHLKQLQESTTRHAGEVEQYRGITEQIKKDLAETSGLLSARRQELDNWMVAYQENSEGKTLEESLSEMTAQKSECSFRLRTHEENKRKIAGFQQELSERRAMSERWAKLNELAGSADGAKFRRIAQGYTLDVLLNYANVQLRQLSRRYRLERVPDTLALQVIDQDMCDEIRTVHSLSGGESFLVSLALALGLSSLSSNRMKVESLFIDEGFGSLDAETLRVAMDALESLRTQGRKIGVISHVQEMTERIPVQIRVNRAGNGRSYLEVI